MVHLVSDRGYRGSLSSGKTEATGAPGSRQQVICPGEKTIRYRGLMRKHRVKAFTMASSIKYSGRSRVRFPSFQRKTNKTLKPDFRRDTVGLHPAGVMVTTTPHIMWYEKPNPAHLTCSPLGRLHCQRAKMDIRDSS